MKKTVKLLIALCVFTLVCNVANADYIIQRFESGVDKPSFEQGEYYVRTTPTQEVTNYTTNNYYETPYTYYPNTYRIITPWVYYGDPYGPRYLTGTGININIGNHHHPGIKPPPPPPPHKSSTQGGRYVPIDSQSSTRRYVPLGSQTSTGYVSPFGSYGNNLPGSQLGQRNYR